MRRTIENFCKQTFVRVPVPLGNSDKSAGNASSVMTGALSPCLHILKVEKAMNSVWSHNEVIATETILEYGRHLQNLLDYVPSKYDPLNS